MDRPTVVIFISGGVSAVCKSDENIRVIIADSDLDPDPDCGDTMVEDAVVYEDDGYTDAAEVEKFAGPLDRGERFTLDANGSPVPMQ